jgi:hypothetical protein
MASIENRNTCLNNFKDPQPKQIYMFDQLTTPHPCD